MIYNVLACYLLIDVAPLTTTLLNKFKREHSKSPKKSVSNERVNPHSPFAQMPVEAKHSANANDKSRSNSPAPTFGGGYTK